MNRVLWIVVSIIILVSMGVGQEHETSSEASGGTRPYFSSRKTADPGKVLEGYIRNLQSTNDGVVESSIAHTAFMVVAFPELDRTATVESLERLSLNGTSPEIRYKAYLANLVAGNPQTFGMILDHDYENVDQFFLAISQRAQTSLLAHDNPP
jgi:hypothetical protein